MEMTYSERLEQAIKNGTRLPYPPDGGLGEPKKKWEDCFSIGDCIKKAIENGELSL